MSKENSIAEHNQLQLQMKDFLQVVSFRLHQEEYAIEITKAKEIILVEGVTRVPQMPEFIEGVINLRGNVIPVVDLRKRFQLPVAELSEQSRIVVTRMESKIIGLIVDSVSQVMKIPKSQIQPPPDTIANLAGEYLTGIAKVENTMIMILDIDRIISSEESKELTIHTTEKKGEKKEPALA